MPEDSCETRPKIGLGAVPRAVVALGMVSLFMDISSEIIHSLLPAFLGLGKRERNCPLPGTRSVCLGRNQSARSGPATPLYARGRSSGL
jgi:hypothetical protein